MGNITVNKVSEFEGEIIETIPQKVIPPSEVKRTVTIKQLKNELELANQKLDGARASKQFDVAQYDNAIARHNTIIADLKAIKDKLVAQIDALKARGIAEPVEEVITLEKDGLSTGLDVEKVL